MLSTVDVLKGDRRALRRAIRVPCELLSEMFDEKVDLELGDLSPFGGFVDTQLALEPGDEVLVSFTPPRSTGFYVLRARVARAGLFRRQRDRHPVGMGLEFLDLGPAEHRALAEALTGIPPRLPGKAHSTDERVAEGTPHVQRETIWVEALDSADEDLGDEISFACESELVTSTRPAYVFES